MGSNEHDHGSGFMRRDIRVCRTQPPQKERGHIVRLIWAFQNVKFLAACFEAWYFLWSIGVGYAQDRVVTVCDVFGRSICGV